MSFCRLDSWLAAQLLHIKHACKWTWQMSLWSGKMLVWSCFYYHFYLPAAVNQTTGDWRLKKGAFLIFLPFYYITKSINNTFKKQTCWPYFSLQKGMNKCDFSWTLKPKPSCWITAKVWEQQAAQAHEILFNSTCVSFTFTNDRNFPIFPS